MHTRPGALKAAEVRRGRRLRWSPHRPAVLFSLFRSPWLLSSQAAGSGAQAPQHPAQGLESPWHFEESTNRYDLDDFLTRQGPTRRRRWVIQSRGFPLQAPPCSSQVAPLERRPVHASPGPGPKHLGVPGPPSLSLVSFLTVAFAVPALPCKPAWLEDHSLGLPTTRYMVLPLGLCWYSMGPELPSSSAY